MSDFQINNYLLTEECDSIAAEIFGEMVLNLASDETPKDYTDDMSDSAWQYADGHEWVIYNYKALMICAHCDFSDGEEFLQDVGLPKDATINSIASIVAFGEIQSRIKIELERLTEEWVDNRPESEKES